MLLMTMMTMKAEEGLGSIWIRGLLHNHYFHNTIKSLEITAADEITIMLIHDGIDDDVNHLTADRGSSGH